MKAHIEKTFGAIVSATLLLLSWGCTSTPRLPGENVMAANGPVHNQPARIQPEIKQTIQEGPQPGDADFHFPDHDSLVSYVSSQRYADGILPVMAQEAPEYAERIIADDHPSFIVADKASMRVLLYDHNGKQLRAYDMACAKNFGNKQRANDCRTPEGIFTISGIYNSVDWLYTDENGVTSPKRGQYGPRFMRLKTPQTSSIGIHGTCAPWSMGHRASHGCIRLTNEHITELSSMVTPGTIVIVLPGIRDRRINRAEGIDVAYFPTAPKYSVKADERRAIEQFHARHHS
ncbi:MAG: L,D-transpeptidase [Muribaculaceae bacterium]|nr:L,D-transpeptidase [Muribaculaceae bacterium]MDE6321319.1 L,D-transpeptidase [Muribaculaceae bacterium]